MTKDWQRKTKQELRKLSILQLIAERKRAEAKIEIMQDYIRKIDSIFKE